jgi:hypothetical protein
LLLDKAAGAVTVLRVAFCTSFSIRTEISVDIREGN